MTTFTIDVTQDDIDNGVAFDAMQCPVAKAMQRHWPYAAVDGKCCWPTHDRKPLPKKALRFVDRFDAGKAVKPFKFKLKV